ncbi:MAG: glyoxylase-like metal-dependent hydrolase (beta-lactamase superfamily II) [Gammaproteobacteria bacterium]|jgi:glyoxylase-like metal-dependent hydrolase (beta-lactamase superfamily II)
MQEKTNPSLTYPLASTPEPGCAVQVHPGVYWLRLPIPFELNHINVWLLEDGDGFTLVDTGISAGRTCKAWEQIFEEVIKDKPITRIIVTHFHPDHFGLAKWLGDRTGAEYYTSQETLERTSFLLNTANKEDIDSRMIFYQQHGIEDKDLFEEFLKGNLYSVIVSGLPEQCHIISEGEKINIGGNDWEVIMTYGHAPGHITLHCETLKLLISGDQILPTITSNVSVYADQPDANPLDEFLQSFNKFKAIAEDTIVLPSHGKVFQGIHTRIGEIVGHHEIMLIKVLSICEQAHSSMELVPQLFRRKLEGINTVLAFGETLANLNYLWAEKKLQRSLESGRYIYRH